MIKYRKKPLNDAGKITWYRELVKAKRYKWYDLEGELNIIGLRGYDIINESSNENIFNEWNDSITFIWKENNKLNIKEFVATTDPGVKYTINKKLKHKAVAHLAEGQYKYRIGRHKTKEGAAIPAMHKNGHGDWTKKIEANVDLNEDGTINEGDAEEQKLQMRKALNIHWGIDWIGKVNDYSHGCQVIPMFSKEEIHKKRLDLRESERFDMKLEGYINKIGMDGKDKNEKLLYSVKPKLIEKYVRHNNIEISYKVKNAYENWRKLKRRKHNKIAQIRLKKLNKDLNQQIKKDAYDRFRKLVTPLFEKSKNNRFSYVLIDMTNAILE